MRGVRLFSHNNPCARVILHRKRNVNRCTRFSLFDDQTLHRTISNVVAIMPQCMCTRCRCGTSTSSAPYMFCDISTWPITMFCFRYQNANKLQKCTVDSTTTHKKCRWFHFVWIIPKQPQPNRSGDQYDNRIRVWISMVIMFSLNSTHKCRTIKTSPMFPFC